MIMMTGELDFDDAFYGEKNDLSVDVDWNAIFGLLFFLAFVFVSTIVLLNLLTGLAVDDVKVSKGFYVMAIWCCLCCALWV